MSIFSRYFEYLTVLQANPEERPIFDQLRHIGMRPRETSDFDLVEYLNGLEKPCVEIAGPTQRFKLLDQHKLSRFLVSNLARPRQTVLDNSKTDTWRDFVASVGRTDIQADGQHLPFASESLGGVLMSAMIHDKDLNEKIIREAHRVLIKGGILILEANEPRDVLFALQNGFEPVKWQRKLDNFFDPYVNIALRKK